MSGTQIFLWVIIPYVCIALFVVGMALLIYRRRTVGPVFSATTRNDKLMCVFLATTILLGLLTTVLTNPRPAKPGWESVGTR